MLFLSDKPFVKYSDFNEWRNAKISGMLPAAQAQ